MASAGKTLTITDVIRPDQLAVAISNQYQEWLNFRRTKQDQWEEVRKYKYAVDTTTTTNNQLPWKNKTTYPKLTQISDNLWANYVKSLFPKRQWMIWEGFDGPSEDPVKKLSIEQYMNTVVDRGGFQKTVGELLDDWILYGNCFSTVEWVDGRVQLEDRQQAGFVGPKLVRINPLSIVFNPIAPSFGESPKIIQKWVTLGDLKEEIENLSATPEEAEGLWNYLKDIRSKQFGGETQVLDEYLSVDGFNNFRSYLGSDYAEVLTFYGDLYDRESGAFYKNHVITIVDRHKLIAKRPNESYFGQAPIFHSGWRTRSDNLWAMGPLDNLVGMQYRIDHLENLKADVFDLNAFPPIKVKGFVEDFTWGPGVKIFVGDDGDVEMVAPHFEILNANLEINELQQKMEEIAGAPKEAMGIRSPGEKTKYEVQRLESASGRIFQCKIEQFSDDQIEPSITAMLELGRRKLTSDTLRIWDDELKIAQFQTITVQDITGNGRIRPVAARHFAEQADLVQNLTQFYNTIGQDPLVSVHFSGLGLAQLFEDVLDIKRFNIVKPFVRVSEQAEAQNLANSAQEQSQMQVQTPSGLTPDDTTPEVVQQLAQKAQQGTPQNV